MKKIYDFFLKPFGSKIMALLFHFPYFVLFLIIGMPLSVIKILIEDGFKGMSMDVFMNTFELWWRDQIGDNMPLWIQIIVLPLIVWASLIYFLIHLIF